MEPRNIVVLRALGGLGDFLCATPALRALRTRFANSRISLIGLEQTRGLARRYPHLIDEFLTFPGFPGIPEEAFSLEQLAGFLAFLGERPAPDLAIQMHGDGSVTNSFLGLLGARMMAGFHVPQLWRPDPQHYGLFPAHLPEARRWLALVERLGCATENERFEWQVSGAERAEVEPLLSALGSRPFAVVHPGGSNPFRRWAASGFAAVADHLHAEGLAIVVTGTGIDRDAVAAVTQAAQVPVHDLSDSTDLGQLGAIVEQAALVVCNDTGIAHLAAALETPSVVVFTTSDVARWGPLDRRLHRPVGLGRRDPRPGTVEWPPAATPPSVSAVIAAADAVVRVPA